MTFIVPLAMAFLQDTGTVLEHYIMPLLESNLLPLEQQEENDNLKACRESVEWSYAKAESLWLLLTSKYHAKLEVERGRTFAEVRVMYFLTNCKVCCYEGSTMTGLRGFQIVPPTLNEYLAMNTNH